MLKPILTLIILLVCIFQFPGIVQAAQIAGSEIRVTSYISDQIDPVVYGDDIVYRDSGLLCHYSIEKRTDNLTNIPVASRVDIADSRIVWWYGNHVNELNLSSGEFVWVATTDSYLREPAITGDHVYWPEGIIYGDTRLYQFDLSKYQKTSYITILNGKSFDRIRAHNDKLVYSIVQSGLGDIFLYDMTRLTQIPICTLPSNQLGAVIYGDRVAWQDNRSGDWDIYSMNIRDGSVQQITDTPSQQINPEIFGDRIIWQDNRNGNWDIYLFNLTEGQEYQVTSNTLDQINPKIYGNEIVWQDNRNGNWDIYLFNIDQNETVIPLLGGKGLPHDTNDDRLYEDVNGNGVFDFADVVLFFNNMDWIATNEPVSAFDFNRNRKIDFNDVVLLFNQI